MKKIFFLLTFLSSIFFVYPYQTNAKALKDTTDDEKVEFFSKHFSFDNFVITKSRAISNGFIFFYFNGDDSVYLGSNGRFYSTVDNSFVLAPSFSSGFDTESKFITGTSPDNCWSLDEILLSSFDIYDNENNLVFAKNYDYVKESGGGVNVEFPFTREEFLLIPFLIATLISMLFLKWCFPMKGGKKL